MLPTCWYYTFYPKPQTSPGIICAKVITNSLLNRIRYPTSDIFDSLNGVRLRTGNVWEFFWEATPVPEVNNTCSSFILVRISARGQDDEISCWDEWVYFSHECLCGTKAAAAISTFEFAYCSISNAQVQRHHPLNLDGFVSKSSDKSGISLNYFYGTSDVLAIRFEGRAGYLPCLLSKFRFAYLFLLYLDWKSLGTNLPVLLTWNKSD